jgi:hypothetical protein
MKKRILLYKALPLLAILLLLNPAVFAGNKKGGSVSKTSAVTKSAASTGKVGDSYRLNINNINMPLNRSGVIAAVNIPDPIPAISGEGGKFGGDVFLFSAGFFLSGAANGNMFANAVASASLVEDYVPGTVESGQSDPRAQMYVVKQEDEPFSQSWIDWEDAVALGADFYDGNNDGVYDPADLNGNGEWDVDEDRPDIIGDETVWCVYNDGLARSARRWNTVSPLGIEVRQTVFAFASKGAIGNIMFVRYRFKYTGLGTAGEPDVLNDCYFGVWSDTDLGDPEDDLIGSDSVRNVGYTYNDGPDNHTQYGSRPPAFFIDFFSGPISYIAGETYVDTDGDNKYTEGADTPLDTAFSVQGQVKGIKAYPGAKNLGISSFVQYINGDAKLNDPDNAVQARYYMLGLDAEGKTVDPCSFAYGEVKTGDCKSVNNRLWYSGDPVTQTGWINTVAADARQMTNIGPFELEKGVEKEIVVAYVVGQGTSALNSIEKARQIDDGAQEIFDNNFLAPAPPPQPDVTILTGEDFIDISWPTPEQVTYNVKTNTYDLRFRGYNVYAFQTYSTSEVVDNQENITLVANYQLNDFIYDLFIENAETGGIEKYDPVSNNRLDYNIYSDPAAGRIRIRITKDPFTGGDLIKGKKYYFAVTSYAVNHDALVNRSATGTVGQNDNYYLSADALIQNVENVQRINIITMADNMYAPPFDEITSERTNGGAGGIVQYDVIEKENLTGDTYKVTFIPDHTTAIYSAYWKLVNETKGITLVDSSKRYLYGSKDVNLPLTDGFIVKVSEEVPHLDTALTVQTTSPVFDAANSKVYYLNTDIPESKRLPSAAAGKLADYNSTYVKADKLRRVEVRFGESGKAYRYLNGFFGTNASQQQRFFKYAAAVTSADTIGKGAVGQWDTANDRALGFVDVPFTVWVKDFETGEERQLACAFIEKRASYGGIPDGAWDPGTNLSRTAEYIIAFNSSYDPSGSQLPYIGGFQNGTTTVWADLNGGGTAFYPLPDNAPYTDEQRAIATSPLFDVLYVFGLQKTADGVSAVQGDKVITTVANYPYTSDDVYTFTTPAKGELTTEEQKALFEKVNVFPNPLYGYNVATSWAGETPDDPFVTFSNLPNDVTIKIFSLSGTLLRTLTTTDKSSAGSSFFTWDLQNESGLRVASGLYIAIVSSPQFGEKILKFSIIMPQKQIQRY